MELLLDQLESRFELVLARMNQLLAAGPGVPMKAIEDVLCSVPPGSRTAALDHFFSNADAAWADRIPTCLLDEPPGSQPVIGHPGAFRWSGWPVSRFLAKVAPDRPKPVFRQIERLFKAGQSLTNPYIHADLVEAAALLPADLAAQWARWEATWLRAQKAIWPPIGHAMTPTIEALLAKGEDQAAFELTVGLLSPGGNPSNKWRTPAIRISEYEYELALERLVPAVARALPMETFEFLLSLMDDALGELSPHDGWSSWWLPAIEDHPQNESRETLSHIAVALRTAAEMAIASEANATEVLDRVASKGVASPFYRRLAHHLIRAAGDETRALAALTSPGAYVGDLWHETCLLLRWARGAMRSADMAAVLVAIDTSEDLADGG